MSIVKWLDKYLEAVFISVGVTIITVVMFAQIICRKCFGFSIIWSEEFCRHLFILIACWGLAYSIRIRNAIEFDMIVTFFPWKAKYIFEIISNALIFAFFAYMLVPSFNVSVTMQRIKATSLPYTMRVIHFIAMAGFVLAGIRALQIIIIDVKALISGVEDQETAKEEQV